MSWNLFGRSLNLTQVVLDLINQNRNDDVMEEFRRNGRDVDIKEEEVNILPKFRNTAMYTLYTNVPKLRTNVPKLRTNVPKAKLECKFCKNNGEQAKFYSSHSLRDSFGNTMCPILLNHTCIICHVKGHTLSYCPKNIQRPQVAPMNILKSTRMANGKSRKAVK